MIKAYNQKKGHPEDRIPVHGVTHAHGEKRSPFFHLLASAEFLQIICKIFPVLTSQCHPRGETWWARRRGREQERVQRCNAAT